MSDTPKHAKKPGGGVWCGATDITPAKTLRPDGGLGVACAACLEAMGDPDYAKFDDDGCLRAADSMSEETRRAKVRDALKRRLVAAGFKPGLPWYDPNLN